MLKTSIVYFAIRAINGVLGLAAVFILTRILSAEQYGVYALGMAAIGLCASIFFQWIIVTIARFYAAHANSPDALLSEGNRLFFRVAALLIIATAIYAVWSPVSSIKPELAVAIGIGVIAAGLHNLGIQLANSRGRPLRYGLLTVSRGVFTLTGAVAFVHLNYGGVGAIFGVALGSILSVMLFRVGRVAQGGHNSRELRGKIISYGLPLTLTYFSTMILDVSDRFMIGWWFGTPAVAGYAAAYDLTQQVVGAILNVFFLAAYPRVTAAWESGGVPAARKAMLPLSHAMLLALPFLAGIFIGGASEISKFAFGAAIRGDAEKIIPWIAIAIAIGGFKSYFLDVAFQLAKVTQVQLRITMVMAVINLFLNLCLMPVFGVLGAAAATTIAFGVGAILSWWYGRNLGVYPLRLNDAVKMALVFFAVIAAMHFLPTKGFGNYLDLIARLTLGGGSYVAAVLITNLVGVRSMLLNKLRQTVIGSRTR